MKRLKLPLEISLIAILGIACNGVRDESGKPRVKSETGLTKVYPLWYSKGDEDKIFKKDSLYLKYYLEYDSLGNITVEKVRSGDVSRDVYYKYKYNLRGQIIEKLQSAWQDFSISESETWSYNGDGKLSTQEFRDISGWVRGFTTYAYNKLGQLEYVAHGSDTVRHNYDEQNNLVKESRNLDFIKYAYDQRNQLIQETLFFNSPDTVSSKWFFYDQRGNRIREVRKDFDSGYMDTVNLIYDTDTNLETYYIQGLDTVIIKYEFY